MNISATTKLQVVVFHPDRFSDETRNIADELIKQHVHINTFLNTKISHLEKTDGFHAIQVINGVKIEYQMKTCCNDNGDLLAVFVFCQKDQTNLDF